MKDGLEPKSHLDKEVPYPKHYDISKDETAAGKADARREAYSNDSCEQDFKAMPDM